MSLDQAGGSRLLFAGGGQAWVWTCCGLVLFVLLLILYREERKLVSRRAGLLLLGLRLSAAALLVAALFEPISAWNRVETIRGKLILAGDVSESMSAVDPGRTDGKPRREIARSLILGETAPLAKLSADHDVATLGFARTGTPEGSTSSLADLFSKPGDPNDSSRLTTDPTPAFEAALRAPDDKPVPGIVLLTDGRFNAASGRPDALLDRLKARGIPIFPVLIGSTASPKDSALAGVKAPEAVFKGDIATIDAVVKADGIAPGSSLAVTLTPAEGKPIEKTVVVPADGGRPVVSFRLPLEKIGPNPLTLSVATPEGDVRPDNNQRVVTIQVADDKVSVLLIEGEARWEFRYLRNALARDPRVKVEAIVPRQPVPVGAMTASHLTALPPLPSTAELVDPLGSHDLIVLGDLGAADASAELWERIGKYVGERGGTLVLLPGPKGWPAILGSNEITRSLTPIVDARVLSAEKEDDTAHPSLPRGVKVMPVPALLDDASGWPMLQLGGDSQASRAVWDGLPRLPWVLGGTAKPTATVIMTSTDGAAVVASQPFGLGKVLWIGTDATWRWRFGVGDLHHHRFWGQVVRWASTQGLGAGDRHVRFGPIRSTIADGETTTIRAKISDTVPNIGAGFLIAARVYPAGGDPEKAVAVIPLRPALGQSRTYEGATPALPEGSWRVRLDAPGLPSEPGAAPLEAPLAVTSRVTSERVELSASRDALDQLAAATGGRVFDESNAAELPGLLKSRVKRETKTEETPLWDHPVGLLLFFGILATEWIIRRKVGLP